MCLKFGSDLASAALSMKAAYAHVIDAMISQLKRLIPITHGH